MTISVLSGKRIVLGVTGSIASYKSADLASKLTQAGAHVEVILTDAAQKFVSQLTFRSVTGRDVHSSMWDNDKHVYHVYLGETAGLFVIAPATAHTIAKLANGLADNLLTVSALAARCPLLVAPAMDGGMYTHPATQENIRTLEKRGVIFAGPGEGRMASGLVGPGRMLEPAELLGHIRVAAGQGGVLSGRTVVVTAGPTQEPLDPVRFLTNRSTGRQGLALAQAAIDAGANVTLIAGPVNEPVPVGSRLILVRTAKEMHDAVLQAVETADILIMAAAVSDFRPAVVADQKIKKGDPDEQIRVLELSKNPDILEALKGQLSISDVRRLRPLIKVGFAAETQDIQRYGREKLLRKGLDLIVINDVGAANAGFAVDTNEVTLIDVSGDLLELPLMSKSEVAERVISRVASMLVSSAEPDVEDRLS